MLQIEISNAFYLSACSTKASFHSIELEAMCFQAILQDFQAILQDFQAIL